MRAESVARIAGGTVRVRLEENLRVGRLQLEQGTIDLAALMARIGQDPGLAGSVDALDMTIENILQPPGMWSATGSASAPVVELDELRLDEVALTLEKQAQTAAVTLAARWWGTSVELAAQADLRQALEEDPARWWHGAGLGGTLEYADLAPARLEDAVAAGGQIVDGAQVEWRFGGHRFPRRFLSVRGASTVDEIAPEGILVGLLS
jgi:hypothetical protein